MLSTLSYYGNSVELQVLLGLPGAGKGASTKILQALVGNRCRFKFISMSDAIDKRSKIPNDIGMALLREMNARRTGKLVSNWPVMNTLREEIIDAIHNGAKKIILDGAVRNIEQAGCLISCGIPFKTYHLKSDEDVCIERILRRASIEGRPDDANEELVRERVRKSVRVISEVARVLKGHNPPNFIPIDSTESIRRRIVVMLRGLGYQGNEMTEVISKLDKKRHPANKILRSLLPHTQTKGEKSLAA